MRVGEAIAMELFTGIDDKFCPFRREPSQVLFIRKHCVVVVLVPFAAFF